MMFSLINKQDSLNITVDFTKDTSLWLDTSYQKWQGNIPSNDNFYLLIDPLAKTNESSTIKMIVMSGELGIWQLGELCLKLPNFKLIKINPRTFSETLLYSDPGIHSKMLIKTKTQLINAYDLNTFRRVADCKVLWIGSTREKWAKSKTTDDVSTDYHVFIHFSEELATGDILVRLVIVSNELDVLQFEKLLDYYNDWQAVVMDVRQVGNLILYTKARNSGVHSKHYNAIWPTTSSLTKDEFIDMHGLNNTNSF